MVLLTFSVERMCRQIGATCGIPPEKVRTGLIDSGLHTRYERGELSTAQCHQAFCDAVGAKSDCAAWSWAASDIFEVNYAMIPVVALVKQARHRVGILSNTSPNHWELVYGRYRWLREMFDVYALSFELGAVKPEPAIYQRSAELAGVAPEECFFTDDIAGHVAGAKSARFDAVVYTSAIQVAADLRKRGVEFNF